MTSIRAAGYSSSGRVGTAAGFPSGSAAGQGPAPPLEVKTSNTPEDVARCLRAPSVLTGCRCILYRSALPWLSSGNLPAWEGLSLPKTCMV